MASHRQPARKPYARPTKSNGQWQHDKFNPGVVAPRKPAAHARETTEDGPIGDRLEVSNLHYEITPKDLISIFGQIGTLVREPTIRYDGSGRSLGKAIVYFETTAEAIRAKNQFDGILAKGQPLSIRHVPRIPVGPRRAASVPLSLLSRIEKPQLLERVARDDADATAASTSTRKTNGPIGGGGRGRIGPIRSRGQHQPRGGRKGGRESKKPKTAEDLDKELDAFMGDTDTATAAENVATTGAEAAAPAADVEMA